MKAKGLLLLFVAAAAASVVTSACTGSADDDDDDGFTGSATPTPSGTVTGSPTPSGTGIPPSPISGFTNGSEVWLCIEHQFPGTISNVAVDDLDAVGCSDSAMGVGFVSTIETPEQDIVFIEGEETAPLSCDVTSKHWTFDLLVDGDRCTGCVNQYEVFDFAPADSFGDFCGTGTLPLATLSAHMAQTTSKLRFTADVLPAFAGSPVTIEKIRVYSTTNAIAKKCTATASIASGGDGIFDADCNPPLNTDPLPEGPYNAMIFGTESGRFFMGYMPFDVEPAP